MRSAKTKQRTHYQPQNLEIAYHTSKQTIRQSAIRIMENSMSLNVEVVIGILLGSQGKF